jgi:hypothetical protein
MQRVADGAGGRSGHPCRAALGWLSRTLLFPLAIVTGVAVYSLGPGAAEAGATCTEYGVFWQMSTGGPLAYGAQNEITLHDQFADPCITPDNNLNASGQTARVFFGVKGYYVEAGWQEYACSKAASGHCFRSFMEWALGGSGAQWRSTNQHKYPCLVSGTQATWSVVGEAAKPTSFDGYLDCEDGRGNRYLTTLDLYPYYQGYGEGEGFFRESSTMAETHQNLEWMDSAGVWHPSLDVFCRYDTSKAPYNWNGLKVSATRFDVVQNSGTDC